MNLHKLYLPALLVLMLMNACGGNGRDYVADQPAAPVVSRLEGVTVPAFNADSAYEFIARQVAFGPRVPNTAAHRQAGDYFIAKFREYGAEVQVQEFTAEAFDGTRLELRNIIASYNPGASKRVLLAAHWDTRPFADKDLDPENHYTPIDGANDGGSGVGVLLEIARLLNEGNLPQVGVDIILYDGEDYGEHEQMNQRQLDRKKVYWCLGSQYWARNKHKAGYTAYFGILLDMVGAKNAAFYREGYSREYAPSVVKRVWAWGNELGHGRYFRFENSEAITDDHVYMNQAGVPSIDIIEFDPGSEFYFGNYHHTLEDTMDIISRETLKAVGETVLHVVYHEQGPAS
ncbi:M28 family peptidase [Cesiribacter andamanensis]|uniref:Alkaline phosphatase isozyme conversion aminopeptidase n=1 Tax=Cesiribacter andamanensis AMV16 TaxID=1279009 RepID=M7N4R5_9BACT|nr:M28 family peptidase [Cesiribacter andamanensis]EMR02267.1 alkaline phosphatase isozyme conversion aminopeptidase [Cesiribacter andamanensis AMV16]